MSYLAGNAVEAPPRPKLGWAVEVAAPTNAGAPKAPPNPAAVEVGAAAPKPKAGAEVAGVPKAVDVAGAPKLRPVEAEKDWDSAGLELLKNNIQLRNQIQAKY